MLLVVPFTVIELVAEGERGETRALILFPLIVVVERAGDEPAPVALARTVKSGASAASFMK